MSKAILMSIKPKWVKEILNGEKTIEIRKSIPKCELPIDVYIYCTKDKKYANLINRGGFLTGMVVARFWCDKVEEIKYHFGYYNMGEWTESYILENSCLTAEELENYLQASKEYDEKKISRVYGYAIHITKLEIFDKPKDISEFLRPQPVWKTSNNHYYKSYQLTRAPQSYCYVEV